MKQYLDLLRHVRERGVRKPTRAVLRSTGAEIYGFGKVARPEDDAVRLDASVDHGFKPDVALSHGSRIELHRAMPAGAEAPGAPSVASHDDAESRIFTTQEFDANDRLRRII